MKSNLRDSTKTGKRQQPQEQKEKVVVQEKECLRFAFTEQEISKLDNLLQWQDYSSRSKVML